MRVVILFVIVTWHSATVNVNEIDFVFRQHRLLGRFLSDRVDYVLS